MKYNRTQVGYSILKILGIVLVVCVALAVILPGWIAILTTAIVFVAGILFASLNIQVDDNSIELRFGPGIIRKSFQISDVVSVAQVTNRSAYGYGVRVTPHGMLYNVSGLDAVELGLRSGKSVRLGTDDPSGLSEAIRARIVPSD